MTRRTLLYAITGRPEAVTQAWDRLAAAERGLPRCAECLTLYVPRLPGSAVDTTDRHGLCRTCSGDSPHLIRRRTAHA